MANKIKLVISGMDYLITSEDDEPYIQSLGTELNHRIDEMLKQNSYLSVTMASVLCALEYSDEAHKARDDAENLRGQLKRYIEDAGSARMETDEARREIERLGRDNQALRNQLAGK